MRTKSFLKHLILGALMLTTCKVIGQVSTASNVAAGPTDFLGWNTNAINNFPLRVRHDLNQPIDWYTNAIHRMRLLPTAVYPIGSFPGQVKTGSLLLSPDVANFYAQGAPGPYSLLHVAAATNSAQSASFREWMETGLTLTGNRDHAYVGLKGKEEDYTDLVLHWSDNPGKQLTDRMRFIFTAGYDPGAASGASSWEGLEGMRLYPKDLREVHVGVGDFFAGNLVDPVNIVEPTERLDVLNGRVRIRQLPDDPAAVDSFYVMVVDRTVLTPSNQERGVVKWVPASTIVSIADCEWTMNPGTNPGDNDVWTAVGGETDECPDETEAVGIGLSNPAAKLDVYTNNYATAAQVRTDNTGGVPVALRVENIGAAATKQGVVIQSINSTTSNLGMVGFVSGTGTSNSGIGMFVGGASATNTGMGAIVNGATGSNIGLSASVTGSPAINVGADVNVNGTPSTTNIGDRIRVGGVSPFNVGANVAVSDGTDDNLGVNVAVTGTGGNRNYGIQINAAGTTARARGVVATVRDATYTGYGAQLSEHSTNALYSHGASGSSFGGSLQSFGVYGHSDASANSNIGAYAYSGPGQGALPGGRHGLYAGVNANAGTDLAAYIDGNAEITGSGVLVGGNWYPSDEQLKQNVQPYAPTDEQTGLFDQLQVYGYAYIPDALPGASLPEGPQVGFMAQQLAELYPQLTRDVVHPARYDSLGQMVSPEVAYKAIRPEGLIPYMTLEIQQLRQQMNAMAEVVAACCANPDLPRSMAGTTTGAEAVEMERLSIRPNPFPGVTRVQYHLTSEGRVRLEVSSNDGRLVAVLADQRMPAGTHNVEWNASDLPAGAYFVALVVDGGVVVKRAVNLAAR